MMRDAQSCQELLQAAWRSPKRRLNLAEPALSRPMRAIQTAGDPVEQFADECHFSALADLLRMGVLYKESPRVYRLVTPAEVLVGERPGDWPSGVRAVFVPSLLRIADQFPEEPRPIPISKFIERALRLVPSGVVEIWLREAGLPENWAEM